MATPGMGKVSLEWESPDEYVGDLLGYNMFRYTFINDTVTTDTLLISKIPDYRSNLIRDYAVVLDKVFFYT